MIRRVLIASWAAMAVALAWSLITGPSLRTPDQTGYRLYSTGEYDRASGAFVDSYWRAIALYKAGEFKEAAGIFAGYDTAEGAYNQGNALLFQGLYEDAVERYSRALELKPEWEEPTTNREIALARAAALDFEGGDMTGGKIGADDYVIDNNSARKEGDRNDGSDEETVEGAPLSEGELRAVWLRQVQTDPADFLKSKFNYQLQAQRKGEAK